MKIIWCMVPEIWSMTDKIFCPYGLFFALLQPRKSKFSKNKKWAWGIILHKLTINDNNMMYGFSGMKHDRHFGLFCALLPRQPTKLKFKKILEISSFYPRAPKIIIHFLWNGAQRMQRRLGLTEKVT